MLPDGKDAVGDVAYQRHRPEQTLLYQIVEAHYPALLEQLGHQGKCLPEHVRREFEDHLKCGRLELDPVMDSQALRLFYIGLLSLKDGFSDGAMTGEAAIARAFFAHFDWP